MNLNQMVRSILGACRLPSDDTHRFQLARQAVNNSIDFVLTHKTDWYFLHKTAEILSESGESRYALPFDFSHLMRVGYDGTKCEVFAPQDVDRYNSDDMASMSHLACTIQQITTSPYASKGYVFLTYGSKTVSGVGTSFTPEMVGRFLRSGRDGEVYRIARYVSGTELELTQEFAGSSQAGLVSVYDGDKTIVRGNPHITNFTEDMTGLLMNIEGNASPITISSVDYNNQNISLISDSAVGTQLIFSIQDSYQIDPPGSYILNFADDLAEDDKVIAVDYYAYQPPLMGPYDTPYLIPLQFHQVILNFAIVEYSTLDDDSQIKITVFENRAEKGLVNMLNTDNPLEPGYKYLSEPDAVSLARTNIVR